MIKIRPEAPSVEMKEGQAILNCFALNKLFYCVIGTACRNTVKEIVVTVNVIFKSQQLNLEIVNDLKLKIEHCSYILYRFALTFKSELINSNSSLLILLYGKTLIHTSQYIQ